jgi:hypothetical protein
MSELTIQGVPAEVIQALEADAVRTNSTVDEVVQRVLKQYAGHAKWSGQPGHARKEIDRIRTEIEKRHGKVDVVVPVLREDRNR